MIPKQDGHILKTPMAQRDMSKPIDVPEDKIRSRYIKTLKLLPQIIDACDKILIYDNSVLPSLIYKKDEEGNDYFPTEIWPIEKLKELIKR